MVVLKGFTSHRGVARGKATIVNASSDLRKIRRGNIIVVESMNCAFINAFFLASAVLIEKDMIGPRDALIARQLDIPMITGVKDLMKHVEEDCFIMVNGNTGEVFL